MNNSAHTQQIQCFIEDLYNRYKLPLLKIIRKYIGNSDMCEDIFHEVFIRIIRKAKMLNQFPRPKLETYIFSIARGVSIDFLRKENKLVQIDIGDEDFLNILETNNQLKSRILNPLKKVELILMLETLPAEERLLLVGKYYLGLSIDDLAEILGYTSTAVRSKIHRAKKHVINEWSKSKLNMEDFIDE